MAFISCTFAAYSLTKASEEETGQIEVCGIEMTPECRTYWLAHLNPGLGFGL